MQCWLSCAKRHKMALRCFGNKLLFTRIADHDEPIIQLGLFVVRPLPFNQSGPEDLYPRHTQNMDNMMQN